MKRYAVSLIYPAEHREEAEVNIKESKSGPYVLYSDHLKEVEVLREALREALGMRYVGEPCRVIERVEELRKLLDPSDHAS